MKYGDWESLLLPVVLVIVGAVVLLGADYGVLSLDRVQDLWPAAIFLVGLVDLVSDDSSKRGQHE